MYETVKQPAYNQMHLTAKAACVCLDFGFVKARKLPLELKREFIIK